MIESWLFLFVGLGWEAWNLGWKLLRRMTSPTHHCHIRL